MSKVGWHPGIEPESDARRVENIRQGVQRANAAGRSPTVYDPRDDSAKAIAGNDRFVKALRQAHPEKEIVR